MGRGVVLNFMHHGCYEGSLASVGRAGVPAVIVVHDYMVRSDAPRWLKQHVLIACSGGGRAFSAKVGSEKLLELLAEGEVLAIAFDVPGRTPVRFAGRDLLGSFGAARLAFRPTHRSSCSPPNVTSAAPTCGCTNPCSPLSSRTRGP